MTRIDGRALDELRGIVIAADASPYAEGSCEISFGRTKVLCTATIEKETPRWMQPGKETGWITAEYGMLPRSTHSRMKREASQGKQGGRTLEIQRLIGRALRQAVDLRAIAGITVRIDCDVLCADGGTRIASVCGGWVALARALQVAVAESIIPELPVLLPVAAVSLGRIAGELCLDLNYDEDSSAEFDLNIVFGGDLSSKSARMIEIQGTGERGTMGEDELMRCIALARKGVAQISRFQADAIRCCCC